MSENYLKYSLPQLVTYSNGQTDKKYSRKYFRRTDGCDEANRRFSHRLMRAYSIRYYCPILYKTGMRRPILVLSPLICSAVITKGRHSGAAATWSGRTRNRQYRSIEAQKEDRITRRSPN